MKGDNGAFEVTYDGKPVFSKLQAGRFPAYQEIPVAITEIGV